STRETKPSPAQSTVSTGPATTPTTRESGARPAPVRPDAAGKAHRPIAPPGSENEKSNRAKPPAIALSFPNLRPHLGAGAFVFPVYGSVAYVDSFGAARSDVPYHHGDDIFAPLGAPVLAVANGTEYSVGWERPGGNRLWLRDRAGNEFYYAHLSA